VTINTRNKGVIVSSLEESLQW